MNLDLDSELNSSFFSGFRSIWIALAAAGLLFALGGLSGCGTIMGGLRPDLDDQNQFDREPTMGGRFSEGSMLDEGRYRSPADDETVGHSERRASEGRLGGQGTWLEAGEDDRLSRRRPSEELDEDGKIRLAERPVMQKKYKNGYRATKADFIDDSRSDGSLWNSDGQTNYFLTKNNIHTQGSLITVATEDEFIRDVAAELKRTLSPDEREAEMEIAQERMRRKAMGLPEEEAAGDKVASSQAGANRAPASAAEPGKDVQIPSATWADVDVRKSMEFKAGDPIMMEVLERYPNGNYKLRGLKRIRFRGQSKMVSVIAIAKHTDISPEETISSGKLYEYRIESVR